MRRGRRRSCDGKKRHETRADAEKALTSLEAKRAAARLYMHTYQCRHCGTWHVGHKPGTGGRRQ